MGNDRVVVIGAGIAGLAAAIDLSTQGFAVTLVEKEAAPGGKMRQIQVSGRPIDAGPTVFTMRDVFDALFADNGAVLEEHLTLQRAEVLARHAWAPDERLDLFANPERSADAIANFAGAGEADRFRRFVARAAGIFDTLDGPFIRGSRPGPITLARRIGMGRVGDLWRITPFANLWRELGSHFHDPRLRQLFGRYATYCGSSPFDAPATLMLVAHVEMAGVWMVKGGMHSLARALAGLAMSRGAELRYGAGATGIDVDGRGRVTGVRLQGGERLAADAVVVTADSAALAAGLFGDAVTRAAPDVPLNARSLSAVTWCMTAPTDGFPLLHHNVFFSDDYKAEFDDIFRRQRIPRCPTVYVCAQDRGGDDTGVLPGGGAERLLCLVNAPPTGDHDGFDDAEVEECENNTFDLLRRCGLSVNRQQAESVITTPAGFARLFPATGGALYGRASHGWMASFRRPGARSRVPGLYLAGGSVHPGPGIPMAALSGRQAARSVIEDRGSMLR